MWRSIIAAVLGGGLLVAALPFPDALARSPLCSEAGVRPHQKIGPPYVVNGRRYVPRADEAYCEVGEASWYGPGFHGHVTANGECFDRAAMTAAHPTLPLPSMALVTNLENGRSAIVRVNDRGPFASGRIIDVSEAVAHRLGFWHNGTAEVEVRFLRMAVPR